MSMDGQGMNVRLHKGSERGEYHPVPFQAWPALEGWGDDGHPEMAPAVPGAGVAGVEVAFVLDFQQFRCKGICQALADGG